MSCSLFRGDVGDVVLNCLDCYAAENGEKKTPRSALVPVPTQWMMMASSKTQGLLRDSRIQSKLLFERTPVNLLNIEFRNM